jgi:hypothetical protein
VWGCIWNIQNSYYEGHIQYRHFLFSLVTFQLENFSQPTQNSEAYFIIKNYPYYVTKSLSALTEILHNSTQMENSLDEEVLSDLSLYITAT